MPSTLNYGITYPAGSVAPNVPIVMQTLAESVDSALGKVEHADKRMVFKNNSFAWGANTAWDAGVLSADISAPASSQVSSPVPAFASAGSLSGTIKFTEPGIYHVHWLIAPQAEPGNSGYRIALSGTWPGSPTIADTFMGQTSRPANAQFWESAVEGIVRVPTANLEIRMTGIQAVATTNVTRVRLTQLVKF